MIGWLILVVYVVGFLITARVYTRRTLNGLSYQAYVNTEDKAMSLIAGVFLGAFWPVVVPIREGFRWAVRRGALTTDYEREQAERELIAAQRAELAEYRRLARENRLPYPEVPDVK